MANLTEIYARIALQKTDFLLERAIFRAQIYQILSANLATNLTHNAACCATDRKIYLKFADRLCANNQGKCSRIVVEHLSGDDFKIFLLNALPIVSRT